jgi:FkbM family methyltransferase
MMGIASTLSFIWSHPLNRGARIASLARFVRWQIGSRLVPQLIALPYVNETTLLTSVGMTGATGNWYCGLQEYQDMAFILHALRPEDLFLDIGANIGSYTVLASGAVGASSIAVEPIPETAKVLEANVGINGLGGRVEVRRLALSDEAGKLRFTSGFDACNRVAGTDETEGVIEVPVTMLDILCADRVPTIIKIDVEGHEMAVIAGGTRTLRDPRVLAVVMETNGSGRRYGVDDADLSQRMAQFGFQACGYDPFTRSLGPPPPAGNNTIFVRNPAAMTTRIVAAPRYQLLNCTL